MAGGGAVPPPYPPRVTAPAVASPPAWARYGAARYGAARYGARNGTGVNVPFRMTADGPPSHRSSTVA